MSKAESVDLSTHHEATKTYCRSGAEGGLAGERSACEQANYHGGGLGLESQWSALSSAMDLFCGDEER
jgi:hypothetical protein